MDEMKQQIAQLQQEITILKSGKFAYPAQEIIKNFFFEGYQGAPAQATLVIGGPGSFSVTANPDGMLTFVFGGKRYWIPYYSPK